MKYRNVIKKYGVVGFGAFGLMLGGAAHAALPASVSTAFTNLQTDALSLVDLAWTSVVPITIAFIILKLFKRASSAGV